MKRRNDEYVLQCAVVDWMRLQYPDVLFNRCVKLVMELGNLYQRNGRSVDE